MSSAAGALSRLVRARLASRCFVAQLRRRPTRSMPIAHADARDLRAQACARSRRNPWHRSGRSAGSPGRSRPVRPRTSRLLRLIATSRRLRRRRRSRHIRCNCGLGSRRAPASTIPLPSSALAKRNIRAACSAKVNVLSSKERAGRSAYNMRPRLDQVSASKRHANASSITTFVILKSDRSAPHPTTASSRFAWRLRAADQGSV